MKQPTCKRVLMLLQNNAFQNDKRPRYEARALLRDGYNVSVICPRPGGAKLYEVMEGVHLYQFPPLPETPGFLGYLLEYAYTTTIMYMLSIVVMIREGFDIVHAHNPPDTFWLLAALYKLLGKHFVFDHHDLAPELYAARFGKRANHMVYQVLVIFEKLSCRMADLIIATNESYKAIEQQRDRVPSKRITIVRNGPLLEALQPVEPDPDLRRRAVSILGYVGHMGPQDGLDYLLRALHILVYVLGKTDFLCILVGAGDALPDLRTLTMQLGLTDHVLFTGWVPPQEVAKYLSAADICVAPDPSNPYNDRCTMIKIMEYMALEKPTVAFDLPENRVTAQDAAVYAHPNNETDFAQQIAALMDDPDRRWLMGRNGSERIKTELAWPYQEKLLLAAYAPLGHISSSK